MPSFLVYIEIKTNFARVFSKQYEFTNINNKLCLRFFKVISL